MNPSEGQAGPSHQLPAAAGLDVLPSLSWGSPRGRTAAFVLGDLGTLMKTEEKNITTEEYWEKARNFEQGTCSSQSTVEEAAGVDGKILAF